MDIQNLSKYQNCIKHPSNPVVFLKINLTSNQPHSQIFYCDECVNEDLTFKSADHILISQLLQQPQDNFLNKWPPINDSSILESLGQKIQDYIPSSTIIQQITSFFTQLKDEIIKRIDLCYKKNMIQIEKFPFAKEQILKKYAQISQIEELKSILVNDQKHSIQELEILYKQFLSQIESKKETITQQLKLLLSQCDEQRQSTSFQKSNTIRQSIFSLVDHIDFFPDQLNLGKQNNNVYSDNFFAQGLSSSQKVMELISNKSNFCTQEFIEKLKINLDKVNLIFNQMPIKDIFSQNKYLIRYLQMNNEILEEINEFTEHLINLQNDNFYSIKDILKEFEFTKTNYQDGKQRIQIVKNIDSTCEIFTCQQPYQGQYVNKITNCISSKILEQSLKYIFRIQLEANNINHTIFRFGLMQLSKSDLLDGYEQRLSFQIDFHNNQFVHYQSIGITKYIKGDKLIVQQNKQMMIELRVWLGGQILQILDFPNYEFQIELKDQFLKNLINLNDLCLYFNLCRDDKKYIIKQAFITEEFQE